MHNIHLSQKVLGVQCPQLLAQLQTHTHIHINK